MGLANKACHNCRRKRLRCDRSLPHCHKCTIAGRECLGYGKLFRWTGAVASRGRLAGQTSSAALVAEPPRPCSPTAAAYPSEAASSASDDTEDRAVDGAADDTVDDVVDVPSTQLVRIAGPAHAEDSQTGLSNPWVLTDPLYQDMTYSSRHYLDYFASNVCKDLVSWDFTDRNPFRHLLAITQTYPLLQHIIVAASAVHLSNFISPALPPSETHGRVICPINVELSQLALRDSMLAKHKALHLMKDALDNLDSFPPEVVLAAAMFFVNTELLESGRHGWRAHLHGAVKLMSVLQLTRSPSSTLIDFLVSDLFIYSILGSAFMPTKTAQAAADESFPELTADNAMLRRAAANSYVCCPPEILGILYSASQLLNAHVEDDESAHQTTLAAAELIYRAQAFDVVEWANSYRDAAEFRQELLESRIHTGSAHQQAACLYTLHAFPAVEAMMEPGFGDQLTQTIFDHLQCIPETDTNYKATSWTTFIFGAATTDPERQKWVMYRLHRLVTLVPWGFLYTAMEVLRIVWGLEGEEKLRGSWIQTLRDPELALLIV